MKTRYFLTLIVLMLIASITVSAQAPWDSDMEFRDGSSFHEFRPEQVNPFTSTIYPGIIVGSATEGPDGGTGGPYVWQGTRWYPLWSDFTAGDNITITHDGSGDVIISATDSEGGIEGVDWEEEGTTVINSDTANFTGIGATVVQSGTKANVQIPGTLVQSASSDIGFASGINFDIEWPHYVDIQENIATVNIKRGTGYPLMVAAYNASATEREYATHLCDGVSDEIEINQALTEAKAHPNGLKVLLSSGDFHPAGAINLDKPDLWVEGTGIRITRIAPKVNYGAVFELGGDLASGGEISDGLQLSNVTIDAGTQFTGYAATDVAGLQPYRNSLFENIYVTNFPGDAFFGTNTNSNQNQYKNIWFYNIGGNCFDFNQEYGTFESIYAQNVDFAVFSFNELGQHTINNVVVRGVGGLLSALTSDNLQVSNARVYSTSSDGIHLDSGPSFYGNNIYMSNIGGDGIDSYINQITLNNFVIETADEAAIELQGSTANITNSRFNGTTAGIYGVDPANNLTLSNCTFTNTTGMLVYLDGYDKVILSDNIFNEGTSNTIYLEKGNKIEISNNFFNGVSNIGIEVIGVGTNSNGKITGNTFWGDDASAFCIAFAEQFGFSPTNFVISNNTVLGTWSSFFAVSGTLDPYPVFVGNDYYDANGNKVVQLSRAASTIFNASDTHMPASSIYENGVNPYLDGNSLVFRYKSSSTIFDVTPGTGGSSGISSLDFQDSGSDIVSATTLNAINDLSITDVGGVATIDYTDPDIVVEDGGVGVVSALSTLNFGTDLQVTDNGSGEVLIDFIGAGGSGISGVAFQDSGSDILTSATMNVTGDLALTNVGGIATLDYTGVSSVTHYVNPIDQPKASADTPDDEFDSGSLAAKWTIVTGATGTVDLLAAPGNIIDPSTRKGFLLLQSSASSTNAVGIRQDYTLPDSSSIIICADFSLMMDGSNAFGDASFSLVLNTSDSDVTANPFIRSNILTNTSEQFLIETGQNGTYTDRQVNGVSRVYFRIARDGLDYTIFYSQNGNHWNPIVTHTAAGAFDNIWIISGSLISDGSASLDEIISVDWLRLGTNDFYPFTH